MVVFSLLFGELSIYYPKRILNITSTLQARAPNTYIILKTTRTKESTLHK